MITKKNDLFCFLIDDDDEDRDFFAFALTDLDDKIKLDFAKSGEDAVGRLKRTKDPIPDFIFLDLNMVPMSGKECLVNLKKIPHLVDVPVIIYSTTLNEKIIYDTLQMGAFDHIEKPAQKEVLTSYLKRVLQIVE